MTSIKKSNNKCQESGENESESVDPYSHYGKDGALKEILLINIK